VKERSSVKAARRFGEISVLFHRSTRPSVLKDTGAVYGLKDKVAECDLRDTGAVYGLKDKEAECDLRDTEATCCLRETDNAVNLLLLTSLRQAQLLHKRLDTLKHFSQPHRGAVEGDLRFNLPKRQQLHTCRRTRLILMLTLSTFDTVCMVYLRQSSSVRLTCAAGKFPLPPSWNNDGRAARKIGMVRVLGNPVSTSPPPSGFQSVHSLSHISQGDDSLA
jgi:hypothetical protein